MIEQKDGGARRYTEVHDTSWIQPSTVRGLVKGEGQNRVTYVLL